MAVLGQREVIMLLTWFGWTPSGLLPFLFRLEEFRLKTSTFDDHYGAISSQSRWGS